MTLAGDWEGGECRQTRKRIAPALDNRLKFSVLATKKHALSSMEEASGMFLDNSNRQMPPKRSNDK
jgi:hypothetical protein